eukprot:3137760-Prymnesium_polylepis.1
MRERWGMAYEARGGGTGHDHTVFRIWCVERVQKRRVSTLRGVRVCVCVASPSCGSSKLNGID